MNYPNDENEQRSLELLRQLRGGNDGAFVELFERHSVAIARIVRFRLDRRLASRVDVDDVVQDVYVEAKKRLDNLIQSPTESFLVWIRMIVRQTLADLARYHLGAQRRSVGREQRSGDFGQSDDSFSMASFLVANLTSPSQAIVKKEVLAQVDICLQAMDDKDREIIAMRHFEELGNNDIAEILEITPKSASIRYVRALSRLKAALGNVPGFSDLSVNHDK